MLPRIFVRIACYRDDECKPTLRDLFAKARHPGRVFAGVCWQYLPGVDRQRAWLDAPPGQVRMIRASAGQSRGVCWARHHVEKLHRGEEYTLQLDSHSRFAPNWDTGLIEELAACASHKPLLSAMPPAYTLPDELDPDARPSICCAKGFDAGGNLRFTGRPLREPIDSPLRGAFVAGGFMFARSEVLGEVPYDPHLYFEQEEASYALRLYTHGWDVFCPRCPMVYHLYRRPGRRNHWSDNRSWRKLSRNGLARFNHLTGYRRSLDPNVLAELHSYSLGHARSLREYERVSGVDFRRKHVQDRGRLGQLDAVENGEARPSMAHERTV